MASRMWIEPTPNKIYFLNGVAGMVFCFIKPKPENNSWKTNLRDERGNFIKKPR